MPKTAAQRRSIDKWDAANMSYQTVKLRTETLSAFLAAVAASGDRVNTVLRRMIEEYIRDHPVDPETEIKPETEQDPES